MNRLGASFRDPACRVVEMEGRVLRVLNHEGDLHARSYLGSEIATELSRSGLIVGTSVVDGAEGSRLLEGVPQWVADELGAPVSLLEHERIQFPSYPQEWPAEMLHAAGSLTLRLTERLFQAGFGLKDATPYNVLFRGARPLLIDFGSIERRDPGDSIWLAYSQFIRTFLLPLLAERIFGLPANQVFLTRRDGLSPEEVYSLSGWNRRLHPRFLELVTLPTLLGRRANGGFKGSVRPPPSDDVDRGRFVLSKLVGNLRRHLNAVAPRQDRKSTWSGYNSTDVHPNAYSETKLRLVESIVAEFAPRSVLDVGCNEGLYSAIAARGGAKVVGIDSDPVVAGSAWRAAAKEELDVLPLVVSLARPTPAVGWENRECSSFLSRASGNFDAVFLLAVVHHLMVSEGIPLEEIFALTATLTTDLAVVEYVGPGDPMFQRLLRGRERLYWELTAEAFETRCLRWFEVVRRVPMSYGDRTMFVLRKRAERAEASAVSE
jgi:SAM-dependent methyltransferase